MDKSRIHILIVDDEPGFCSGLREALQREGYQAVAASDSESALGLLEKGLFNLVITDIKMPGLDGMDLMKRIKICSPDTLVLLITAYGTVSSAVEAMKGGAYDYLAKPVDIRLLRSTVAKALEFQAVMSENKELRLRLQKRSEPSPLAGASEAIRAVSELIEEVAASDVTVLISGESGTGKEIAARAIHFRSRRGDKPFVSVNCAALPESLIESELFGHVKGAFTGASSDKKGRFEMADHGTLFLDEVGELSAAGQADLLRVIEGGAFRKVGSSEMVHVDVRLIAATNKNLEQIVAQKTFREDLYYRLNVVPIRMPALREHPEDIPLLLESFLEHFSVRHKRPRKVVSSEVIQICQRYLWPGNVRQLRNMTERLVVTCHHRAVKVKDLPDFLQTHFHVTPAFTVHPGTSLAEVEKLLIRQTMTHVTANRREMARLLGISRRALQYKLKTYGLLKKPWRDGCTVTPGDGAKNALSALSGEGGPEKLESFEASSL